MRRVHAAQKILYQKILLTNIFFNGINITGGIMKYFSGIILFFLVANAAFCDEFFVITDYYSFDYDKKIIRFATFKYYNGNFSYTYVLSRFMKIMKLVSN